MIDFSSLNQVQQAARSMIQSDLRFLYTVTRHIDPSKSNYIPSLLPYLGVVIDGAEDWVKAVNNSCKNKLPIPQFTRDEEKFYEQIRISVKLWQQDYDAIYDLLEQAHSESDHYFGSICKPIAQKLHLYDIYGVDTVNGALCGNTILCRYYSPFFQYDGNNGEYVKSMAKIGGEYIALFNALREYQVDDTLNFDVCDYGGFVKSPVGNDFSDRFVLFSILCQINFLIFCIDRWIKEEMPTKLRFAYLLYYSLLNVIPQINDKLGTCFILDDQWKNDKFRNAMAHYKLGVALKNKDLLHDDIMFGLTEHILGAEYRVVKESIYAQLEKLAIQIGNYLGLKEGLVVPNGW